jgi:WD40 repeat protein
LLADGLREPCLLFAEDVDADGRIDLVSADSSRVVWLRQLGPAAFADAQPLEKPLHGLEAIVPPPSNVAIWDTATGHVLSTLFPLQHNPRSMAMSPDGRTVATCGDDNQVRLRQYESAKQLAIVTLPDPRVESLTFSPDGNTLAIAHGDDCLLWNVTTKTFHAKLHGHESGVRRSVFSPSGRQIATLSHDLTVGLWETETGRRQRTFFSFSDRPYCACFSPDEDTMAVGTKDGVVSLWDVQSGQELCVLARFDDTEIQAISFQGSQELLAVVYDRSEAVARLQSFRTN